MRITRHLAYELRPPTVARGWSDLRSRSKLSYRPLWYSMWQPQLYFPHMCVAPEQIRPLQCDTSSRGIFFNQSKSGPLMGLRERRSILQLKIEMIWRSRTSKCTLGYQGVVTVKTEIHLGLVYPQPGLNLNVCCILHPVTTPRPGLTRCLEFSMASPPREHQSIVGIPIVQATFLQKGELVLGCWLPEFRRDLRTTMQFGVCNYEVHLLHAGTLG